MEPRTLVALAIFAVTYALLSLRRIPFLNLDRPTVALAGAVAMVACGVLPLDAAYAAINLDTLALLLGTMVTIAYLREARFFEWVAHRILRAATTPRRLLVLVVFASGILSALFVNDTICLLFTPILLEALAAARLPPVPYLIALVTGANVGSAATLTGNPQNMLIGISSGISYGSFALVQAPLALLSLAVTAALLVALYRRRIPERFGVLPDGARRVNGVVVRRVLAILALVLAGFLLPVERLVPGLGTGQRLPFVALAGAIASILFGRYRPARALARVDFGLLLLFCGLFIVVRGLASTPLLDGLHASLAPHLGASTAAQATSFSLFTLIGSNLVSNVPFVLLARDWIAAFPHPILFWHVLATASTFAGNLTIVGSVANVIVLEQAKDVAPIGFLTYLRAGLPITLATLAVALAGLLAVARFAPAFG
jgi:Na+/H+ antiporter NhaD/arsenite permease-like protein